MTALRTVFTLLLVTFGAGACSHYQLGTDHTPAFRTLYLEPVANRTHLAQSQPILARELRQAFIRDGRVRLVNSPSNADAILTVAITEYFREVAAAREDDTGLARKFNLTLGVTCSLQGNRPGANGWENRTVRTQREAFTDGGQLQSEYQALPLLAEALAKKVLHATLDAW
jgi:hypothetical protein